MPTRSSLLHPFRTVTIGLIALLTPPLTHASWEDEKGFQGDEVTLNEVTLPYRYFAPKEQSVPLPLVIYLHGMGQRGEDNLKQLSDQATLWTEPWMQEAHPCYVLAPQTRDDLFWINHNGENTIRHVYQMVDELAARYSIDRSRIYLTGNSMGGCGTWGAIWHRPDYFAAAIPVAGTVSGKPYTDPQVQEDFLKLKATPIWAWNCAEDKVITPQGVRAAHKRLAKHGMRYTELHYDERMKTSPHGLSRSKAFTPNALFPDQTNWELYNWLFSH